MFLLRSNGERMQGWTFDTVTDLYRRMESRAASGFRVSAKTGALVVVALRHYAREHFGDAPAGYTIDVWSPDGSRIETHYAQVNNLAAAGDVYDRAVEQRPGAYVTLRQGIRVVRRSMERP